MPRAKNGRFAKKGDVSRVEKLVASTAERKTKLQITKAAKLMLADDEPTMLVHVGRRVVELDTLAKELWCTACDIPLSLRNLEKEQQMGLSSIMTVRCRDCLAEYSVHTSKKVPNLNGCKSLYASNCKAALGCIDSGMGPEVLKKFLSTLNIPVLHHHTYQRAYDFISQYVVKAADESCREAIEREKRLALELLLEKGVNAPESSISEFLAHHGDSFMPEENEDDPLPLQEITMNKPDMTPKKRRRSGPSSPEQRKKQNTEEGNTEVGITVKYDFGWDKRGSGFRYDSRSGRGSLFGQLTNACLGYMVMSSYCRKCAMGASPDDHVCVRNHDGSAKAMEPRAAVQLCLNNPDLAKANVRVDTIVADRDASTFSALQRESSHPINRLVDLNHNLKGINNELYLLKKTFTWLTTDCIEYLKRCFQKAIKQNKNDVEAVRKAILNIVPHVYNEHDGCGGWCKAKTQPDHPFKNLPQMRPLSDPVFRVRLATIFKDQAAEAAQLAACGSTQVNENFNHMVVSRSAKSRFYGGTNALKTRVAGAVCVKNIGITYTDNVFQSAQLSPTVTKGRESLKKAIERKRLYQQLPEVKRRRLQLKFEDRWHEAKENSTGGITYASGMGNVMEQAVAATTAAASDDQINSWIPPASVLQPDCALVFVDLETTGFQANCEILQIAATCGSLQYSAYMLPQGTISQQASVVTGLKVVRGKLVHNSVALPTKPPRIVASEFLDFIKKCGQQVVLVGHNVVRFDAPRIVQFMKNFGEPMELCEAVHGLVDTVPHIRQGNVAKLELFAKEYLTDPKWAVHKKNAHNALSDCALLEGLLDHFSISKEALLSSRVTMVDFMKRQVVLRNQKRLATHLAVFKAAGVSMCMIKKMAGAGVTMEELKTVMLAKGTKGIGPCLGVQINGKPRVTCNKKIVEAIASFVRQAVEADGVDISHLE